MTEKTLTRLAAEYNELAAKADLPPVKRFADKPSALKRIGVALERIAAATPEPMEETPAQPAPVDFVHNISEVPTVVEDGEAQSARIEVEEKTPTNVVAFPVHDYPVSQDPRVKKLARNARRSGGSVAIDLRTEMSSFPVLATVEERSREDLVADAVAKAKAVPTPVAKKGRGVTAVGTRASAVRALIAEGKLSDDEILAEVRKTYPALPNNAVKYYRWQMGL